MICSLYELSAQAAVKDLNILKTCNVQFLHKCILYKLVRTCFTEPKKTLAFSVMIQNWPMEIFSMNAVGVDMKEEDIVLIASLTQKRQIGSIKVFDLVCGKFGQFDERATNAILEACTNRESLLSIKCYQNTNVVSRSYNEALQVARGISCFGKPSETQHSEGMTKMEVDDEELQDVIAAENPPTVRVEFVVNSKNCAEVIQVMKFQNPSKDYGVFLRVIVARLVFDYMPASEIAKVLQVMNVDDLCGVDLSFNCLFNNSGARLKLLCKKLQRFENLKCLSLAYNSIDSTVLMIDIFKALPKLEYLDLSSNRLGETLPNLLLNLKSDILNTLILSGCAVGRDGLNSLVLCDKFHHLQKLKLDQNSNLVKWLPIFTKLLNKIKKSLRYLDISSCEVTKEDICNLCSIFCELVNLHCLVIWPNPGITAESIKFEVLSLLKDLPNLKDLPPIKDVHVLLQS